MSSAKASVRGDTADRAEDAAGHAAQFRRALSRNEYIDGILRGNRSILSRAITLIESSLDRDRELAEEIVEACLPYSGASVRMGITGVPGAGKSTLIEALGRHVTGECGERVAVLAVDPTSQLTGGSILGDKTRMLSLAACERAFIRPSPSRGSFGGVAQHTREVILLCEAAGFQNILVETVGVGQSETAVRDMVDFYLLVMLAGAGDELQGMKRGVMELTDLIAVNKADGENIATAEKARADAEHALHFFPAPESGWMPRAIACSAVAGRGVAELWNGVREFVELTKANGWFEAQRREQRKKWFRESLERGVMQLFRSHPVVRTEMAVCEREVLDGNMTPVRVARRLLEVYAGRGATER